MRKRLIMSIGFLFLATIVAFVITVISYPSANHAEELATVKILEGAWHYDKNPDNDYSPYILEVTVGTTVTWINEDPVPHTVTTKDKMLNSPYLYKGDSFSYTFTEADEYNYFCSPHPWMKGIVIVRAN